MLWVLVLLAPFCSSRVRLPEGGGPKKAAIGCWVVGALVGGLVGAVLGATATACAGSMQWYGADAPQVYWFPTHVSAQQSPLSQLHKALLVVASQ